MSSSLAALWALHFSLSLIWVEGTRHLTEARGHAVAVAAFTVYDQQHPCLFSDRSDERRHVFLFPSGQKKAGQSSDSHIHIAGYDLIKLVAWRAQLHKLMSLCGQQDIVDQSLLDSDSQYLKASLKTLSTVMEEYSVEAKKQSSSAWEQLGRWVFEVPKTIDNALGKIPPTPFYDAEQHMVVAVTNEENAKYVLESLRQSPGFSKSATVYMHVNVTWECCDYCTWSLMSRFNDFKRLYSPDNPFEMVLSALIPFRGTKSMPSNGVQRMIDAWSDKNVANCTRFLPLWNGPYAHDKSK